MFLQFLEKVNLYLMHQSHLKVYTELPASYSAKPKKYWPILHNCLSHYANRKVVQYFDVKYTNFQHFVWISSLL